MHGVARHGERTGRIIRRRGQILVQSIQKIRRADGEQSNAVIERITIDEFGSKFTIHTITSKNRIRGKCANVKMTPM